MNEGTPDESQEATPAQGSVSAQDSAAAEVPAVPQEITQPPVEVEIRRTVRFGRLMIVGAGIGAILGVLISLSFPVVNEQQYTMAQIAGFMLLVGAAVGLALGGLLGLLLNLSAKKQRGSGVAVQSDVR